MKFKIAILLLVFGSYNNSLFAWENKKTHPAITNNSITASAADNYLKTQLGLSGGLSTQLYWDFPSDIETRMTTNDKVEPTKTKTVLDWLKAGSSIEDEDGKWIPWRPRHHFYDPTRNAGLDNHTAHPEWNGPGTSSWLPLGASALDWAIDGSASYKPYTNNEKWSNARNMFYSALTAQSQSDREAYLAESLLKLGCVLHLLEDMGVPAHTRNDFLYGHYRSIYKWDWGNDLENDVETKITANGGSSLWDGSSAVAFDKLTKYFDTDTRVSDNYLGNSVLPPDTWGLSEATNYQFWSLSTISGYLLKYYFPHPHKAYMGTPITEGTVHKKIYFNGVNYGVSHMARESYTYYYTVTAGPNLTPETMELVDSTNTTDDEKVFVDYANITIPRTIDYTTGLANYFFRGRLNATAECIECNTIELTVTNLSDNSGTSQTLKGGTFELYWDASNGNRTQITSFVIDGGWTSSSTLTYNGNITVTFIKPTGAEPVKYVVVYKGNICQNPADIDSDDENAIATTTVTAPYDCCVTPVYASNDCCCFLDPSTPAWSSTTTYNLNDIVYYSVYGIYKSAQNNNLNKTPHQTQNTVWWTKLNNVSPCSNPNWNSIPPYGGIGKSPKYLKITFAGLKFPGSTEGCNSCGGECYDDENDISAGSPNRSFTLENKGDGIYECQTIPEDVGKSDWWVRVQIRNTTNNPNFQIMLVKLTGELDGYGQGPSVWTNGEWYSTNYPDYVFGTDGLVYKCILSHTAAANNRPITGANWNIYWVKELLCFCMTQFFTSIQGVCSDEDVVQWSSGRYYKKDEFIAVWTGVLKTYICKQNHLSQANNSPETGANWATYWELLSNSCQMFARDILIQNSADAVNGGVYNLAPVETSCGGWQENHSYNLGDLVAAWAANWSSGITYTGPYYSEYIVVNYAGKLYRNRSDSNLNKVPPNNPDYWFDMNIPMEECFTCKQAYTSPTSGSTWLNNHAYSVGDRVRGTNGVDYVCRNAHTSTSDRRPISGVDYGAYWTNNSSRPGAGGYFASSWINTRRATGTAKIEIGKGSYSFWAIAYDYVEGNTVIGTDGKIYVCLTAHTSTINDEPITGANWETYWGLAGCCGE